MGAPGNPQPKHGIWTGVIVAGGMLATVLALFASQAFAAGITVSSATINDGTTVYPTVFEADWNAGTVRTWTLTPNVTGGTVTTVFASGTKAGGPRSVTVQLLDGAATVISTGCGTLSTSPWSATVDVVPDVTFSTVARVKAIGGNSACP